MDKSPITPEIRAKAEVYVGDEVCQEKFQLLLREVGLPSGLLPVKDAEECGYIEETGFVWLKQKKKTEHKFKSIGKPVSYAPYVTAHVEKSRIKKLTGVKAKELLIWVTISEIYVDDPPTGKITFKTPTGMTRTFPVSAFEIQEEVYKEAKQTKEANATITVNAK
ncbi:PREDICTED: uncharacterized protein LOC104607056 [Nelumbo nucifera]|uniref:Uncharacterized protein LOC104607056 n=2 Tax=Nelumbo nucifera TaxID=4432 RepID=A0A1U8ASB6_NELNU|nr:PREDICTED: uncharacterized protein LOC104607056 [Nelumbo nucifera]DAD38345.1 TPA_asm: hypothetical protein HUJ06_008986 [Nelumbo nucifera]